MRCLAVIPARLFSNRFPGKLLHPIMGKPMLSWIIDYTKKVYFFNEVVVATEDEEIVNFMRGHHSDTRYFINKRPVHCGSQRVLEVSRSLYQYNVYVSIPADEPLVNFTEINKLSRDIEKRSDWDIATLYTKFYCREDLESKLSCKLVSDRNNFMLYGSRAVIPSSKSEEDLDLSIYKKHVGLMFFTEDFLFQKGEDLWSRWHSQSEEIESLEQDRFVDFRAKVKLFEIKHDYFGVDQEWQIKVLEDRFRQINK
jgi:3-deoxy-manno-octulosonate cytidylyltransferase (CMP-KDO synthetase)